MVSDKKIFFPIMNLWELMTPGAYQFGSQGHGWQDLCRSTKHCYILNRLALGLMASEKKIFEGSLAIEFYINK